MPFVDRARQPARDMVPPGAHRVGFGKGLDLRLRIEGDDEAWALLEWEGAGKPAELRVVSET